MVCYNELGCFRDEGPFNYLDLLPAPPEEINTRFFLYTPRNRDAPHPLVYNNASTILTSPYNATLPTKVMIHGFGSSCQRIWAKEMRTALISVVSRPNRSILTSYNFDIRYTYYFSPQGDVNVICVDWENGANLPNYVRAAVNARLVGRQVALLVNAINGMLGSKNGDFHLIGFSLGAHVAGFAGSELRNVSRITGLFENIFSGQDRIKINSDLAQDSIRLVRCLKITTQEFDWIRPTQIWLTSSIPTAKKSTWADLEPGHLWATSTSTPTVVACRKDARISSSEPSVT